ncbi:MAG TPA: PAS domain S-box protein [Blastocatellia bacterium]|nr:PAS domain S-box protein [Blastocatellia bacterium]
MMTRGKTATIGLNLIGTALLCAGGIVICLSPAVARAQRAVTPKRILALYWDSKDYPSNVVFDQSFQEVLKSSPQWIECYPEYLDIDRFPGEAQSRFMRDYLRQKYADTIDIVVAIGDPPLDFLLKSRDDLFPRAPVIFLANKPPTPEQIAAGPGFTGFVNYGPYRETVDLALNLHPGTEHVFIVSGSLLQTKIYENTCRLDLKDYESPATINYLTDLSLDELTVKMKSLPERSLVLYVFQRAKDEQGRLFDARDILALVAKSASVPIYGMASWQLGRGIVGGYVRAMETNGARAAGIALQIANGARAQDIPVDNVPIAPMFDWSELQRWGISESRLPPGSIVRFHVPSFWDENKWYAIAVISVVIVQSLLIMGLVINRTRRKWAEEALREAQESLTIAVEASQMGTWDLDLTKDFSGHRSLRHDQIFGYDSPQTQWGRKIARRHIVEEDREVFDAAFARGMKTGELEFEARIRWANGSIHWMAVRGRFYFNKSGQPVRGAGVNFDITERKRAEAALRESEERFRGIYEHAPMGIAITDWQWYFQHCNSAYTAMLGYTEEELRHKVFSELVHPDDRDANIAEIRLLMAGEVPFFEIDNRYVRKDGEIVWVHKLVSVLRDEKGVPAYFLALVTDITERKRADEALRESEERFRNMADTAPVMIWISGADKLYTYFNQQWLTFTGRTMGEELGNGWTREIHPDDFERSLETYNTAFNKREPFRMEYRLRRVDGQFRWMLDSGTARFSPSGEFLGFIGSCIDITERKAAEKSLAGLSGQLIRARENECARIARELHDDLNQRMALISIELEQLGQNYPATNGGFHGRLQGILKQAADVSRDIHRISYDLHPSKLTQLGLVAAVTGLCDDAMSSHQLKIEFRYDGVPADLPRDVSLCLYRIAQECLNNVIKHSGAAEAKVELHGTANEFRLRVTDSGKGFDVESPQIWQGLGLISMRERLRLVGGQISIVSRAPSGTQIDATVPLGQLTVDYEDHSPDESRGSASC